MEPLGLLAVVAFLTMLFRASPFLPKEARRKYAADFSKFL
jgi:hypothetical protein